ncbi:hypothetical protein [Couchioplanes caeruleus]|uniref:Uncharacterized protein n=1 Tax=Couchioplanes caeruleus TaxID=56438 RepID=A0A3N1GIZ5_9ACTN|nr:hypothetical protein [Couchioplanes caeruleus]ROP30169.1 hypothetical protein EDD30_3003 [Couchioplanes caeruleus]
MRTSRAATIITAVVVVLMAAGAGIWALRGNAQEPERAAAPGTSAPAPSPARPAPPPDSAA